jgi:hypothetical protein
VGPPTFSRHRLRLAGVLVPAAVRSALPASPRRRQRALTCTAARVLTALDVRVEVHAPAVAWPRPGVGRLVVANRVSPLDDLALATVVRGAVGVGTWPTANRDRLRSGAGTARLLRDGETVVGHPEGTTTGTQLGRFGPELFEAAVDADARVCPVAVHWRTDPLVVEVHMLPALAPGGADSGTLAALAEYAIAGVLEARAGAPLPQRAAASAVRSDAARPSR